MAYSLFHLYVLSLHYFLSLLSFAYYRPMFALSSYQLKVDRKNPEI